MIECQVPSTVGAMPRLGRLAAIDERDNRPQYSMAAPPTDRTFRNHLSPGGMWDQGNTSECVSYAVNKWLVSHQVVNTPPMSLHNFYKELQRNDEWPGEDYDGTSVRAGFKVLQRMGLVSTYTWGKEPEQVYRHVLEIAPVVMGTDWTDGMFRPDRHGYIWPTGAIAGGHSWLLTCVNRRRLNPDGSIGAVRKWGSWGREWGDNGKAWIAFHVFEKLLAGLTRWPGEAATAHEIRVR